MRLNPVESSVYAQRRLTPSTPNRLWNIQQHKSRANLKSLPCTFRADHSIASCVRIFPSNLYCIKVPQNGSRTIKNNAYRAGATVLGPRYPVLLGHGRGETASPSAAVPRVWEDWIRWQIHSDLESFLLLRVPRRLVAPGDGDFLTLNTRI